MSLDSVPLISVIVPIYKVEGELEKCVSSIVAQSYKNLEIILVDDGSPDNCPKICDDFAQKDSRIKVIHKKNEGLVKARKAGIEASKGEFISYVDGDDWIETDFIKNLFEAQKNSDADIVAAGYSRDIGIFSEKLNNLIPFGVYTKDRLETEIYPKMICFRPFFCFGLCSYLWNKLFRRDVIYEAQMNVDERITIGEDTATTFYALLKANSLCVVSDASYHYFQKPFSMLKSLGSLEKENESIAILENYLKNSLSAFPQYLVLLPQIERYIESLRLIRLGEDIEKAFNISLSDSTKIAILGAGIVGQNLYSVFKTNGVCEVTGWFDRDYEIYNNHGLQVQKIDDVKNCEFDYILIASLDKNVILQETEKLIASGVHKDKIKSLGISEKQPNLLFYANSTLLEGPVWNENLNLLLCVSIEQERIFLIDAENQVVSTFKTQGQVGFAVFENDENIIYAAYDGVFRLNIESGNEEFLFHTIKNGNLRYNDGKLDPKGRLLLGTTGYKSFRENQNFLYSYDLSTGKLLTLVEKTSISNGIGFYGGYMFFIDTPTRKVGCYFYNVETGEVKFDKHIIEIKGEGVPDGMCVDKNGNIYVAIWGGYRVEKYNQNGEKISEIRLPVKNVSSCCIGGENMDTLFITTAKHDDGTESEPMAGGLFGIGLIDKYQYL